MLSTPFARPIFLRIPDVDPRHRIEIALLFVATAYVLLVRVDDVAKFGLQVWALLAWCWCLARERQCLGRRFISRVVWRPDAGWFADLRDGRECPAELKSTTRVFVKFSIVSLNIKGVGSVSLIVWPGMIEHSAYRRLRVILRLGDD
jgi:hypothetical protein